MSPPRTNHTIGGSHERHIHHIRPSAPPVPHRSPAARSAAGSAAGRRVGEKEYIFTDASGNADVRIGQKAWQGMQVSAGDTVLLYGKVRRHWEHTFIDIRRVVRP